MTIVVSYNYLLVAEIVAKPNVALVAGRIFTYEPGIDDGSVFTSAVHGDKIHVREIDNRLIVTRWENETGDNSAMLITGTDGDSVYRSDGRIIGFHKLAQQIADEASP